MKIEQIKKGSLEQQEELPKESEEDKHIARAAENGNELSKQMISSLADYFRGENVFDFYSDEDFANVLFIFLQILSNKVYINEEINAVEEAHKCEIEIFKAILEYTGKDMYKLMDRVDRDPNRTVVKSEEES